MPHVGAVGSKGCRSSSSTGMVFRSNKSKSKTHTHTFHGVWLDFYALGLLIVFIVRCRRLPFAFLVRIGRLFGMMNVLSGELIKTHNDRLNLCLPEYSRK